MSKYYSSSIAFGANQTKTEQVVVSPTKIGSVTTDAVSGALTVDEVPTLDSLNPVSSDGVARAVIQAGAELPTRGSTDTGKVLTVKNSAGDLEWDEPAEELPDMTGKDGKLLGAVDNNGTMEAQWVNAPDSYPSVTGNANKVLTVNSGATGVEWADTQLPEEKSLASTNNTISITEGTTTVSIDVVNPLPSTLGTAGQVLTVNSGATGVEWATPSGGGGSSDVFIAEDSTTQGDVYNAYTSGKVLFYKASSGEMYYMSLSQFSTSTMLYFFAAYVGGYGTHATVVHVDAYINLSNGSPVAPTAPFSAALGNFETIQTPSPLPSYSTTSDVGKVLQVTANGLAWVLPT